MWSWIDFVSNILLFVPIGLFFAAAVERVRPQVRRVSTVCGVFAAGALLSTAIEFGQAFVSWRTPSVIDLLAEAAGSATGLVLWRAWARELDLLVSAAADLMRRSTPTAQLLLVYCAGFASIWLLPFDFTLRPAEIADKYRHLRLLLPLTPSPDAATAAELALTFVGAVPVGGAAALCGCAPGARRSVARASLVAAPPLVVLGLAQALVFSRTTDMTALLAALAGAVVGTAGARLAPLRAARLGRERRFE